VKGYIASILERDLHWERDSYILKIADGVATITLQPVSSELTLDVHPSNKLLLGGMYS
jgi:hypothetical protein